MYQDAWYVCEGKTMYICKCIKMHGMFMKKKLCVSVCVYVYKRIDARYVWEGKTVCVVCLYIYVCKCIKMLSCYRMCICCTVCMAFFYFRCRTAGQKSVFGRFCDRPSRHRLFLISLCLKARFQVATTCFSCSTPDLNLVVTNLTFCLHVK